MEIMTFLISALELITYFLFSYFILHNNIKYSLKKIIYIFAIYLIIYSLLQVFVNEYITFFEFILYLIIFVVINEGTFWHKIKSFIAAWLITGFIDILLFTLLNIIFDINHSNIVQIFSIICVNILWLIISLQMKKYDDSNDIINLPKTIYLNILITFFSSSMMLMILNVLQNELMQSTKIMIIVIVLITLTLSAITINHFINSDKLKFLYLDKSLMLERDLKLQNDYFLSINRQYETIRSINHDMHAHLFCINTLINERKQNELKKYLKELIEKTDFDRTKYFCPDTYISSVLYSLLPRFEYSNINFDFVYLLPNDMKLTPIEKSSLFYNLITNSIEACEKKIGNREITLKIDFLHSIVLITIKNTVEPDFSINNYLDKRTSKDDVYSHGIGLYNIDKIIEKYNGFKHALIKDDDFEINIVLYNVLD